MRSGTPRTPQTRRPQAPGTRPARRRTLGLMLALFALGGCALTPAVSVRVDAIAAAGEQSGRRYTLVPAAAGTPAFDLQYKEFAGYVHRTLAGLGYEVAAAGAPADLIIALGYGVGEPQEKIYSFSVPEWGPWRARAPYPSGGGFGYRTEVDSYTTFARSVGLAAYAAHDGGRGDQLWRVIAVSRGEGEDLRRLFPLLLTALAPYIGRDTGGQVLLTLAEDDARVLELKAPRRQPEQ